MSDHEATGAPISITLRMPPPVAAALAALETATGGVIPRHRLALEALRRGALLLAATPGALFAVDPEAVALADLRVMHWRELCAADALAA